MVFKKIFKTKSDSNINQNSLNYPIFTNFLGGACPQPPKQKAWPCPAPQRIIIALTHANLHLACMYKLNKL